MVYLPTTYEAQMKLEIVHFKNHSKENACQTLDLNLWPMTYASYQVTLGFVWQKIRINLTYDL
jgi:hypothetical protein